MTVIQCLVLECTCYWFIFFEWACRYIHASPHCRLILQSLILLKIVAGDSKIGIFLLYLSLLERFGHLLRVLYFFISEVFLLTLFAARSLNFSSDSVSSNNTLCSLIVELKISSCILDPHPLYVDQAEKLDSCLWIDALVIVDGLVVYIGDTQCFSCTSGGLRVICWARRLHDRMSMKWGLESALIIADHVWVLRNLIMRHRHASVPWGLLHAPMIKLLRVLLVGHLKDIVHCLLLTGWICVINHIN